MSEKICFVVTGFGEKTDYQTGRKLDLNKTYQHLIKPVFDKLKITCFRACDVPISGVIDLSMYENILKADIVVADISTLNANAIYELGVRHALKPQSTIVIAEDQLAYPFDVNHILISRYEHLGKDIGASEVERFTTELTKLVNTILATPKVDSPVYTFLANLKPPAFTTEEKQQIRESAAVASANNDSIITLLKEAEDFKKQEKFEEAIQKLNQAKQMDPNNPFIVQRIALITYKSKKPDTITALKEAIKILEPLSPATTNDAETLGLCGAINKRLHEETGFTMFLDNAKIFYERGFIVSKDYYNGINYAYLLLLSASLANNENEKITDITNAQRVRSKTKKICTDLMNQQTFLDMTDRVWILLTLAEIAFVENVVQEEEKYLEDAKKQGAGTFDMSSYQDQKNKLVLILAKLK